MVCGMKQNTIALFRLWESWGRSVKTRGARGRGEGQGTEKGVQIDVSQENTSTDINCTSPLPQSATSTTIWILREKGRDRNGGRYKGWELAATILINIVFCDIFLYHRPWGTKLYIFHLACEMNRSCNHNNSGNIIFERLQLKYISIESESQSDHLIWWSKKNWEWLTTIVRKCETRM